LLSYNAQTQNLGIDLDTRHISNKRVLVVDDDVDTIDLIKQILILADFDVASAQSGTETMKILNRVKPDAILLDLMMPEMDGKTTLEQIRGVTNTPVLVVSAITNKEAIVDLLNSGSDDYITKPFDRAEMIARINAQIRRAHSNQFFDGVSIPELNLVLDFSRSEIFLDGIPVQLSPKELAIMQCLTQNIPNVVPYQQISQHVWGSYQSKSKNRIKYLIYSIRKKFSAIDPKTEIITTVGRNGYRIRTV